MDISEENKPAIDEMKVNKIPLSDSLKDLQTLEIEARGNLQQTLDTLNTELGTSMQARPEGFHLTIISPPESGKLSNITDEQIARLLQINNDIQKGEGVVIDGVGYIDGFTAPNIRVADKAKRTSYLAVDIPALKQFREDLGLPDKDFHITLGFEGGDIHMQVIGQNEKGKDILGLISKKANPDMVSFTPRKIEFSSISGQQRQQSSKIAI